MLGASGLDYDHHLHHHDEGAASSHFFERGCPARRRGGPHTAPQGPVSQQKASVDCFGRAVRPCRVWKFHIVQWGRVRAASMGAPCRGWCRFERRIGTFGIPRGMDRGAFCRQGRPRGGAEVPPRGTSLSRLPGPAPPQSPVRQAPTSTRQPSTMRRRPYSQPCMGKRRRWKHWQRPGLWAVAVQSLPNVVVIPLKMRRGGFLAVSTERLEPICRRRTMTHGPLPT